MYNVYGNIFIIERRDPSFCPVWVNQLEGFTNWYLGLEGLLNQHIGFFLAISFTSLLGQCYQWSS